MSKTVIIVQARMGSTRLPGKALKRVKGKALLSYLLDRLKMTTKSDEIVVATTTDERDLPIINLCKEENVPVFRGSEEDVLDRFYQTSKERGAEIIVRITADCPLMDPQIVDQVIAKFKLGAYDYVSNIQNRTYPRGMDVEVFSFEALERAHREATKPEEREHVTLYLYRHPEQFKLGSVEQEEDTSHYRLTVDTLEDFQLVSLLLETGKITLSDLLALLKENPEWEKINATVQQKPICECE